MRTMRACGRVSLERGLNYQKFELMRVNFNNIYFFAINLTTSNKNWYNPQHELEIN